MKLLNLLLGRRPAPKVGDIVRDKNDPWGAREIFDKKSNDKLNQLPVSGPETDALMDKRQRVLLARKSAAKKMASQAPSPTQSPTPVPPNIDEVRDKYNKRKIISTRKLRELAPSLGTRNIDDIEVIPGRGFRKD